MFRNVETVILNCNTSKDKSKRYDVDVGIALHIPTLVSFVLLNMREKTAQIIGPQIRDASVEIKAPVLREHFDGCPRFPAP